MKLARNKLAVKVVFNYRFGIFFFVILCFELVSLLLFFATRKKTCRSLITLSKNESRTGNLCKCNNNNNNKKERGNYGNGTRQIIPINYTSSKTCWENIFPPPLPLFLWIIFSFFGKGAFFLSSPRPTITAARAESNEYHRRSIKFPKQWR